MQKLKKFSTNTLWHRAGFTLIEALIAITMTLIIMLALAQGFKQLSYDISQGRARLTLSDQLRGVSEILRNDLAGLTVDVDPTSKTAKSGYFLYYEGPIADHHPVTVPINNLLAAGGGTTEQNLSTSKYGDFDDILMFTARSQGDWFRGKVPLAIVKGATLGGAYVPVASDWTTSVVVASEYAEIAYFMVPKIVPTLNAAPTPYGEYVANGDLTLPFVDNDSAVNPGAIVATGNAIPDQFNLCRRVLLILPSLNITATGQLFSAGGSSPAVKMQAGPVSDPMNLIASAENSRLALLNAYQRCDLSVRRSIPTAAPLDPTNNGSLVYANVPIVANSLESLANPMNRFAHVTLPGGVIGAALFDRSMPILSLSAAIPLQNYAIGTNVLLPVRPDGTYPECGFIRPEFLKRKFNPATGAVVLAPYPGGGLVEELSNEEVLAINCVGFDLKGFDPIARLLYNKGPDAGVRGRYNAEGAGVADGSDAWADLGLSGSDDLVVSPSDPGYLASIQYTIGAPNISTNMVPATLAQVTASQGTFVDLSWAFKTPFVPSAALLSFFGTALSGAEIDSTSRLIPSVSLRKSGHVVGGLTAAGGAPPSITAQVYQPCFDSYTEAFEHDGFRQWDRVHPATVPPVPPVPPVAEGTIFSNGLYLMAGVTSPNSGIADLSANGLDDDGTGLVDDYVEQDGSPPFVTPMSSIQALIRLEDGPTSVIQQIAVTQDLLTH